MANHPSAEKRNRQRIVRTERNRRVKGAVRTRWKKARAAVTSTGAKGADIAATVAAAVNEHGAMAGADQRWNLIAPITAMAEATMQQDHGRARPVCRVPDSSPVVVHVTLIAGHGQGQGAMRFEILEVVVV